MVVIADEEPTFRKRFVETLARHDYAVLEARSASHLKELCLARNPSLLILSLSFSAQTGSLRLLEDLRRDPKTKALPVFLLGRYVDRLRKRTERLGSVALFRKPVNLVRLLATLTQWIARAPHEPGGPVQESQEPPATGTRGPEVLYADDDEQWVEIVSTWLKRAGYSVRTLSSGTGVVGCVRTAQDLPDCVVLDYQLGDMTASEVCKAMKSTPSWQKIPIIILTSHPEMRSTAAKDEAIQFVVKTKGQDALLTTVQTVIKEYERARGVIEVGDLKLDPTQRRVYHEGRLAGTLRHAPFTIFYYLVSRAHRFISREELLSKALGWTAGDVEEKYGPDSRAVASHIHTIRDSLGDALAKRIIYQKDGGYCYMAPHLTSLVPD